MCQLCLKEPPATKHARLCAACATAAKSRGGKGWAKHRVALAKLVKSWREGTLDFDNLPPIGELDLPIELVEEILEHKIAKSDNKAWNLGRDWL